MKQLERVAGLVLLIIAVGFGIFLYRSEPTALIDPNDNTFQYALVERTNAVLSYADISCRGVFKPFCVLTRLTDHWVPNWAQGYNLPYYYSHMPQIVIVLSWKLIGPLLHVSLFSYYHMVIYLLLCTFPISIYLALTMLGMSPLIAGFGALLAPLVSTDGLYGIDPSSFLWRGYGLSSQLFSVIWLPLTLSYGYRLLVKKENIPVPAAVFLALTTAGHLGIGIMAFLSLGVLALSPFALSILRKESDTVSFRSIILPIVRVCMVFSIVFVLLGYWIVPVLIDGNYHNISVWDGIWKFDSFGFRPVLANLLNGDLFDFGRFPVLTAVVMVGLFGALTTEFAPLAVLFIFWVLMYFGRTTWGGVIDLVPGMSEFHLSRFIVGVHMAGMFLIPLGLEVCSRLLASKNHRQVLFITVVIGIFVCFIAVPQTVRYASHNDYLIGRGNELYKKDSADIDLLFTELNTRMRAQPGRVFAGRGGSWGKEFTLAETELYMHLSTYGIPVILWLPETWSPNSDTEQYFSEENQAHYTLYNVRYVVTPVNLPDAQIQPFWKPLAAGKTWKLYEVETEGYISGGIRPAIVSSSKTEFRSLIRLWMHSLAPGERLYPEITFDQSYPKTTGLPNFRMLDEVTYVVPDGSTHNVLSEVPRYVAPTSSGPVPKVLSQTEDGGMRFTAQVTVPDSCRECVVILHQTYHPSWKATVDGNPVQPFAVFPFYTAVKLESSGVHNVSFAYEPSIAKVALLIISIATVIGLATFVCVSKRLF